MIYLLDELVRGKAPSVKIGKGRATEGRSNLLTVLAQPEVVRRTV